jgi:hypothetical protein
MSIPPQDQEKFQRRRFSFKSISADTETIGERIRKYRKVLIKGGNLSELEAFHQYGMAGIGNGKVPSHRKSKSPP